MTHCKNKKCGSILSCRPVLGFPVMSSPPGHISLTTLDVTTVTMTLHGASCLRTSKPGLKVKHHSFKKCGNKKSCVMHGRAGQIIERRRHMARSAPAHQACTFSRDRLIEQFFPKTGWLNLFSFVLFGIKNALKMHVISWSTNSINWLIGGGCSCKIASQIKM